jgi:hypothetical protein
MNKDRLVALLNFAAYDIDPDRQFSVDIDPIMEKFAAKVAEECLLAITLNMNTANLTTENSFGYLEGLKDAIEGIKDHFGVEE